VRLRDAAPQLKDAARAPQRLFFGGPVGLDKLMLLLRTRRAEAGMVPVVDDLYFSVDAELLERWLALQKTERELRLFAGHAGWGPGQLTRELTRGDWHLLPATAAQVFDANVETLWQRLIERAPAPEIEV
jgi:putative transcriptional regulator